MSVYVWSSSLSYADYLQADSMVSDVTDAVDRSGARISSNLAQIDSSIRQSTDAITVQFSEVASQLASQTEVAEFQHKVLETISGDIQELTAAFNWSSCQILAELGEMNRNLSDLVKLARTPAQTAAYEQFEIARDAFRKRLYSDCLESLERAISGDGRSPGYKMEWRFHQLAATIRLGFRGCDRRLFDLAKAEEEAMLAARYARTDFPVEAGRAFLMAGWAAYCRGEVDSAQKYTALSIRHWPSLPEAHYQRAKILMHAGRAADGLAALREALKRDRSYCLKVPLDRDFARDLPALTRFLGEECKALRTRAADALERADATIAKLDDTVPVDFAQEQVSGAKRALGRAHARFDSGTVLGYHVAAEQAHLASTTAEAVLAFRGRVEPLRRLRASAIEKKVQKECDELLETHTRAMKVKFRGSYAIVVPVIWLILARGAALVDPRRHAFGADLGALLYWLGCGVVYVWASIAPQGSTTSDGKPADENLDQFIFAGGSKDLGDVLAKLLFLPMLAVACLPVTIACSLYGRRTLRPPEL